MDRRLLSIPSKISQDTRKSLRHINSLRHKPVNQLSQCHLSLRANSPKCNNSILCHWIAASSVVEIATTKTRVQHRRPNVGHVGRWLTLPVFVKKNNNVSQLYKTAHHLPTLSKNSAATSLYLLTLWTQMTVYNPG